MNVTQLPADEPTQVSSPLLRPDPILNFTPINDSVAVRDDAELGWRVVLVHGIPLVSYHVTDKHSERFACVRLRLDDFAEQLEIVRVFGHTRMTQHRWEQRYLKGGLPALAPYRPAGRPVSVSTAVEAMAVRLHDQGLGMRRIAERLGISLHVVAGVYKRRDLQAHSTEQQQALAVRLEPEEEEPAAEATSGETAAHTEEEGPVAEEQPDEDGSPAAEDWDGLQRPVYESETGVAWGGVLLAMPVLQRQRVLEVFFDLYHSLGLLAVYGLQTMVSLMVCLALWRFKRPEHLKEHSPSALGRALGLPRVPEVKTVRRKLAQLAGRGQAREVMLALAKVRVEQNEELLGMLYVDGHVRPYSGKRDLSKGYSMQRHTPIRATTDTWANDCHGDPLFVVTSEINEGLTQTLEPVLAEARALAGDERRMTVIFDRGGFSPQLFVGLIRKGFDLITYRKGSTADLPVKEFQRRVVVADGHRTEYWLADRPQVRVGQADLEWDDDTRRPLELREVIRLKPDTGHQTKVLTTRSDLPPEQVLWRMFARWRQENFFKYMMEEFAIDGLVEYGCLGVDPNLERPNPEHRAISREIANLKVTITSLQGQRCELIGDVDARRDPPPGFERFVPGRDDAKQLYHQIRDAKQALAELEARRAEIPARISAGDLERLKTERQQLAAVFKMTAYNIETELVRMVAPHHARSEDEGRTLIAAALRSPADLEVYGRELRVTLAPQSSPHRSRAIADLCADLNKLGAVVPGTSLRLILDCAIGPAPDVTS